jgi:hypothetical protein
MIMPEFIKNGDEMHSLTALKQESTHEKLASLFGRHLDVGGADP